MTRASQHTALDNLTKARLLEIAARFDFEIAAARQKSQVIDALVKSKAITFEQLLGAMKLQELKKICRSQGLDPTARAKQVLIDRIVGAKEPPAKPKASAFVAEDAGLGYRLEARSPTAERDNTKLRLQLFALGVAGGYRGRDADARFARALIHCFGWAPSDTLPAEIPAIVRVVQRGKGVDHRLSALLRERRALLHVIDREQSTREAWTELLPILLQLTPTPQYVVLTNQRDLDLYDLAWSRTEPRLPIALDQLPKQSKAFPFLARDWVPGSTPQIVNDERVSKHVADLVARVYRSFKAEHPGREKEVIRFTLQCIIAMFAEDIGLLPVAYFTSLLYQAASHGDANARVAELFRVMSTPYDGQREIRYFNGGLFRDPITLPINASQLATLTEAAEADWSFVDPHIFGAVFQGIMDDDERHATGAHYTAKDDILKVVGPTIVEPWRRRIAAATTLSELRALRKELTQFRVLDPACGSGNFLYVAFRELYRLETEILGKMQEFPSVADDPQARSSWGSGIPTTNFFGIDINPFAVELARATLNIAKKIAFDERHHLAAERFKQVEMELDPSLPLDNLETNIVCADALFVEWPAADAIVGNPPFLTGAEISREISPEYADRLRHKFEGFHGRADLCTYWFRLAQDNLPPRGRAGLIGTNSIREGHSRTASLDYLIASGSTITNAISSSNWPGAAAVKVSMVNWHKGHIQGPHMLIVDGHVYPRSTIRSHLQLHTDTRAATKLKANSAGTTEGIHIGTKSCMLDMNAAVKIWEEPESRRSVRPVAHGKYLLGSRSALPPDYIVDMSHCNDINQAKKGKMAFAFIKENKLPEVEEKSASFAGWLDRWWQAWRPRKKFFTSLGQKKRFIVCSKHAARSVFAFIDRDFFPTHSLQAFGFDDDYSFGILQSNVHWKWAVSQGSKIKEDIRYTTQIWRTFPWPQQPPEQAVVAVAEAARRLRATRQRLMQDNQWSLRALYQAADVPGPHPLKDAQAQLDQAVAAAYDLPTGQDPLEFLLELNLALAEDEAEGHTICGPGLPPELDPHDPRFTSDDCIQPPTLDPKERNHG